MKVSSVDDSSVQSAAVQLARLSGPHGYRFEGDTVYLNAMFALLDPGAHDRSWALQLWACPSAPASAKDLAGHVVAEVSLPPMSELADETEHFEVGAIARPPAGVGEHVMVLVLASGRHGQFSDIHDIAVYPRTQEFIQPRLSGSVGYRLEGGRVQIMVDRVENPRSAENSSGTLSLELWALPAPFDGGDFQGHHLAGVEIGSVDGQFELPLQPVDLAFNPPPTGNWQIVLMLREWTASGFLTRDFTNFATRFVVAPAIDNGSVTALVPAPVVEKPAAVPAGTVSTPAVEKPGTPVAAPTTAPIVAKAAPPVIASIPAPPVIAKAKAPVVSKASAPKAGKPAAPAATTKAPSDVTAKCVSVNNARVEELAAIEGLNPKLAEAIVKKRPFNSLDELRKVKGLGVKVLAAIRSRLKL